LQKVHDTLESLKIQKYPAPFWRLKPEHAKIFKQIQNDFVIINFYILKAEVLEIIKILQWIKTQKITFHKVKVSH